MLSMFSDAKMKIINISNFNTESVERMSSMFAGCSNLISLDLSSFKIIKVYETNSMFFGCYNLKNLKLWSHDDGSIFR